MAGISDSNTVQHLNVSGNARIHVGSNITIQQGGSKCLHHLRGTDPRLDKERIEDLKGGLLSNLCKWVFADAAFEQWKNQSDNRLLWIRGGPGKGKTMLLCGIIDEMQKMQTAKVAYFFCQASNKALSSSVAVLRGLVYMLATEHDAVRELVEEKYKTAGKNLFLDDNAWFALRRMFNNILDRKDMRPMIIIIDALDECTDGLLQLLDIIISVSATEPHVKWIVSSRYTSSIHDHLQEATQTRVLRIELGAGSEDESFTTFLQTKVEALASSRAYDKEAKLAVKLHFERNADANLLWISLACQALKAIDPEQVVQVVHQFPRGLDCLYSHLFTQMTRPTSDNTLQKTDLDICRQILAVAAVATRPVSLAEMSCLIGIGPQDAAQYVGMCNAFLTVREETVYFVHQSARDFFLSPAASAAPISIDIPATHQAIFRRSLKDMQSTLKRDLYGLQQTEVSIDEIVRPQEDPLAPIAYSCLHWIHHLAFFASESSEGVVDLLCDAVIVHHFLRDCFLYWLEAISLLKTLPSGIRAMARLLTLSKEQSKAKDLADLVQDALRVMKFHQPGIENFPLQIYAGVLLFTPRKSLVRQLFQFEEPDYLVTKPNIGDHWPSFLLAFEEHQDNVVVMASSRGPDDSLVASASEDGAIKVWEATHGECLQSIRVSGMEKMDDKALIALPQHVEAKRVICAVKATVHIWDLSTGAREGTLKDPTDSDIMALSFLNGSTSQCVSLTALGEATIWDLDSRKAIKTVTVWQEGVRILGYGRLIYAKFAYHCSNSTRLLIRYRTMGTWFGASRPMSVWELETGRCLQTIPDNSALAGATGFSFRGDLIAEAAVIDEGNSQDHRINIWDVATGKLHRKLKESTSAWSIQFSRDSAQVVFLTGPGGWYGTRVSVWDVEAGQCLRILDTSSSNWSQMQVVSDTMHLAISHGNRINVLETSSEESKILDEGLRPVQGGIRLSENERYALFWTTTNAIWVSDLKTGQIVWKGEPSRGLRLLSKWQAMPDDCFSQCVRHESAEEALPGLSDPPLTARHSYGVEFPGNWVQKNGRRLIWIPFQYRPRSIHIRGSTIAAQLQSSAIYHLRFDEN